MKVQRGYKTELRFMTKLPSVKQEWNRRFGVFLRFPDFRRFSETVHGPNGVVKIVHCFKNALTYDVKFMREKEGKVVTQTYTFDEHELAPFTKGGVAFEDDDAVQIIRCWQTDEGEVSAIIKVWVKIGLEDGIYMMEHEFDVPLKKVRSKKKKEDFPQKVTTK